MKKEKSSVSFALLQGLFTGVCTFVVCLILYVFLTKTATELAAIMFDVPISIACTALICLLIQIVLVKNNVKKGSVPAMPPLKDQAAYVLVPKNLIVFTLLTTVMAFLLLGCGVVGALSIFAPQCVIPRVGYALFKSILSGLAGGYVTFHANVFAGAFYQAKGNADNS